MDGKFAARLRELREQKGFTQKQLAELAGMTLSGVTHLEQGLREPSWATVQALAAALGVDCTAFQQEPSERPAAGPGRPPKDKAPGQAKGKRRRKESA
jgi:transcriptional regulator with XRE-family HTH domain